MNCIYGISVLQKEHDFLFFQTFITVRDTIKGRNFCEKKFSPPIRRNKFREIYHNSSIRKNFFCEINKSKFAILEN